MSTFNQLSEFPDKAVERQAVKIPNLAFLSLAGVSIIGAIGIALRHRKETDAANFIGQWATTFMLFGLYNKMAKIEAKLLESPKTQAA